MLFDKENKNGAISDEELDNVTGGSVGTGATVSDAPFPLNTFPIVKDQDSCPQWICCQHESANCTCITSVYSTYAAVCARCKFQVWVGGYMVCKHITNRVNK